MNVLSQMRLLKVWGFICVCVCVSFFNCTIKVGAYEIGSLQKEGASFRWEAFSVERSMESGKSSASLLVADDSLK